MRRLLPALIRLALLGAVVAIGYKVARRRSSPGADAFSASWPPITTAHDAASAVAGNGQAPPVSEEAVVEPPPVEPVVVEPPPVEPPPVEPVLEEDAAVEPVVMEPPPVEPLPVEPVVVEDAAMETASSSWVEPKGTTCPASHPVKAKLASGVFHLPGMMHYDRTKPDRCYADPASAEADGLRQAKR
ncbi:MAG: hypothetical protein M3P53_04550 [Actinomycetota bacterium]|nr:hypothetical protein [Actinomycetota bacterium]